MSTEHDLPTIAADAHAHWQRQMRRRDAAPPCPRCEELTREVERLRDVIASLVEEPPMRVVPGR